MNYKNISIALIFLLNFQNIFSQWISTEKESLKPISIWCSDGNVVELKKDSDTINFIDWYEGISVFCPEISSVIREDLESAYNRAQSNEYLYVPRNPEATIENLEYKFLYRNYDNKLKISSDWSDNISAYRIEASDATIKKIVVNNEVAYSVNPKGTECVFNLIIKDLNGKESILESRTYSVITLPSPKIVNETVSKKEGAILEFEYSANSPIASYVIETIEIPVLNLTITDNNIISPIQLKKLKKNSSVSIVLTVFDAESGNTLRVAHNLNVVE